MGRRKSYALTGSKFSTHPLELHLKTRYPLLLFHFPTYQRLSRLLPTPIAGQRYLPSTISLSGITQRPHPKTRR